MMESAHSPRERQMESARGEKEVAHLFGGKETSSGLLASLITRRTESGSFVRTQEEQEVAHLFGGKTTSSGLLAGLLHGEVAHLFGGKETSSRLLASLIDLDSKVWTILEIMGR